MTEQKQKFAQMCAKLGDLYLTKQVLETDIQNLSKELLELLKEIKNGEPKP